MKEDRDRLDSPTYRLAYEDLDFLGRPDLRPIRLQLELLKPEMLHQEHGINSTIVVFGGTRIPAPGEARRRLAAAEKRLKKSPGDRTARDNLVRAQHLHRNSHYYEEAREFGRIVSSVCQIDGQCEFVIVTGGGPGVMEAANRGAAESGAKSIGLSIVLPEEQVPNPYVTPELCFRFNYFAIRKMHFLLRAKALVAFPGGFGTLDELFETLTLLQTRRIPPVPVLLFGRSYWSRIIDFEELARQGTIDSSDLDLFKYVESAQEAWASIAAFHGLADRSSRR